MIPRLLIGCDPEFVIKNNGNLRISAASYFREAQRTYGYVGLDGNSTVGEIRPAAAASPEELVMNIHACLSLAYLILKEQDVLDQLSLYAGTFQVGLPLGGHVHFGGNLAEAPYKSVVGKLLDKTLGVMTKVIAPPERVQRRLGCGYGSFGAHRTQGYGTEWRTPPSWIINKPIAQSFIELTFHIYSACMLQSEKYGSIREFALVDPSTSALTWWLEKENYSKLNDYAKLGAEFLHNLLGDRLNHGYFLLELVERGEQWNEDIPLFESWDITPDQVLPEGLERTPHQSYITTVVDFLNQQDDKNTKENCQECNQPAKVLIAPFSKTVCPKCGYSLCLNCQEAIYGYRKNLVKCPECESPFYDEGYYDY